MKQTEDSLNEERYKIIEPFLIGEKKLKEIQQESNISYSTLKRWVNSYKKNGLNGLNKKKRQEKSNFRSLNKNSEVIIENLYKENPNLMVSKLYNLVLSKFKKLGIEKISYPTLYRVVNNLDSFSKDYAEQYLYRANYKNTIYRIDFFEINDFNQKYYIYFCFDVATLELLNYYVSSNKFLINDYYSFLRSTILYNSNKDSLSIPKEVVLGDFNSNKNLLSIKINQENNISFYSSSNKNNNNKDFFERIYKDITSLIESNCISFETINKILDTYLPEKILLQKKKDDNFDNRLDNLLKSTKRKVQLYGLRLNNILYTSPSLKKLIGQEVEIKFDTLDKNYIFIYKNDFISIATPKEI